MTHVDFSAGEVCFVQLCHSDFSDNCGFLEKGAWSDSSHMAPGGENIAINIFGQFNDWVLLITKHIGTKIVRGFTWAFKKLITLSDSQKTKHLAFLSAMVLLRV